MKPPLLTIALMFGLANISAAADTSSEAEAATEKNAAVKALVQRYLRVEEQLDRSVRYTKKTESGNGTTIEHAWYNGCDDLIKVSVEDTSPAGRELTEYFAFDFGNVGRMFMLTRKETIRSDGETQIEESRQYFGDDETLVRELTKSGHFKPGESLDTVHIPNVIVDLANQPKDSGSEEEQLKARYEFLSKPEAIASALKQVGPAESDPFGAVKGDAEKYRAIHDTASPDGRYAIALGFTRVPIDWEQFADSHNPGTYSTGGYDYEDAADYGKTVNYVVNLTTRRILGKTNGDFYGTQQRYNLNDCKVFWSPDSRTFVEVTTWKWGYTTCCVGRISSGGKLLDTLDLGKYAEKTAAAYLAKHKGAKYKGSIDIFVTNVTNAGDINLIIDGQEDSGERKGDLDFSLDESIRLHETSSGLNLETIKVAVDTDQ